MFISLQIFIEPGSWKFWVQEQSGIPHRSSESSVNAKTGQRSNNKQHCLKFILLIIFHYEFLLTISSKNCCSIFLKGYSFPIFSWFVKHWDLLVLGLKSRISSFIWDPFIVHYSLCITKHVSFKNLNLLRSSFFKLWQNIIDHNLIQVAD